MRLPKLALLIAIALLSSCASLLYNAVFSSKAEEIKLTNLKTQGEVVFIPMIHIGYKSFYEDVARKVDSLDQSGYTFIYETVRTKLKDSVQVDLVYRKLRKVLGAQPSVIGERVDTTNRLLFNQISYPENLDLISQPNYAALNLDPAKSILGDVPIEELIAAFEQKNGVIGLSQCDLKTGFDGPYNCSDLGISARMDFTENYIIEYRDSVLVQSYLKLKYPKVVIIYGGKHFKGFCKRLQAYDRNWEVVKK